MNRDPAAHPVPRLRTTVVSGYGYAEWERRDGGGEGEHRAQDAAWGLGLGLGLAADPACSEGGGREALS